MSLKIAVIIWHSAKVDNAIFNMFVTFTHDDMKYWLC